MAGALSWTLGLKDGMSGPGAAMGGVLSSITSKLRAAGAASDAFQKKQAGVIQPRTIGTSIGPRGATATDITKSVGSELAANMRKHDAQAFADVTKKANAATRAIEAYNKAASKASSGTLFSARSTMGKTGANGAGLFGKPPELGAFAKLQQLMGNLFGAKGANGVAAFRDGLGKAGAAAEKLQGPLRAVGSAFLAVGAFALKAGAVVAGALVAGAIGLGKFIAEMQAFKQSTMFAFGALLGGATQAGAAWEKVKAVSLSTGTSLVEVGGAFNSLLAQGFNLDEVDTLVKRMADLKTLNPAANIDGIARAISQIKSTGKLQGDELMQLNEAGLSSKLVYEELAKSLGKTVPEIQKMQKAGQITDKMAIDAIQKAIAKQTGGKAPGALAIEAANKTLTGAIGKMYSAVQVWASGLNIDFSSLGRFADRIGKVLSGDAGKKLGASIEGAFAKVLGILDGISEKDLSVGIEVIAGMIDAAGSAAVDFAGAIATIDGWMTSLGSKTSAWSMAFTGVGAAIGSVGDYLLSTVLGPVYLIWDALSSMGVGIVNIGNGVRTAVASILGPIGSVLVELERMFNLVAKLSGIGGAIGAALPPGVLQGAAQNSTTRPTNDPLSEAIRKATAPNAGSGEPAKSATGAPAPNDAKPGAPPPRGPTSVTVTANGLTFEGFEARVAEIVRAEMEKG